MAKKHQIYFTIKIIIFKNKNKYLTINFKNNC